MRRYWCWRMKPQMTHLIHWSGGEAMKWSIQHWHVLHLMSFPSLQCQWNQKGCLVGITEFDKRLISRCNLTITDLRSYLNVTTVEVIECLHWWVKAGLIQGVLESLTMDDDVMDDGEAVTEEDLYG